MGEPMFTRALLGTLVKHKQGRILTRMAGPVDNGMISTPGTRGLHGLPAEMLKVAHRIIESGAMIGKLVDKY